MKNLKAIMIIKKYIERHSFIYRLSIYVPSHSICRHFSNNVLMYMDKNALNKKHIIIQKHTDRLEGRRHDVFQSHHLKIPTKMTIEFL